jgi:transcriptional regulator with XRE-family HTH domain
MSAATELANPVIDAIRRRMERRGLTRVGLARKAKLKDTYVRDILQGRSKNPRTDHLVAIATALNCSVMELLDPELANGPIRDSEVVDKPEERAWLAYFRALPPESRERLLLDMIRGRLPLTEKTAA